MLLASKKKKKKKKSKLVCTLNDVDIFTLPKTKGTSFIVLDDIPALETSSFSSQVGKCEANTEIFNQNDEQ